MPVAGLEINFILQEKILELRIQESVDLFDHGAVFK
jgi:hypothetical protein